MVYGRCVDDGTDYDHEKQTSGSNDEFSKSDKCKNQYNVYKSRAKDKDNNN